MSQNQCFYTRIFVMSILTITWPIYGYFMFKWYQNRNHFVIQNRWPNISLVIIVSAITIQILSIIEIATCSKPLETISIGITNMISGLVFYRAQLLYLRCLRSRQYLNQYCNKAQTKSIRIKKTENRCCSYFSKTILPITITTSSAIVVLRFLHSPFVVLCFLITMLIGIISLINILRKKLTDSIGVSKEILLQICTQFTIMVLLPLINSVVPSYIEVNYWATFLAVTLYGFATFYVALSVIQKTVICAKKYQQDENTCVQSHQTTSLQHHNPSILSPDGKLRTSSNESITVEIKTAPLSVSNSTSYKSSARHRVSASVQLQLQLHDINSETLRKSLQQFIRYDISNYALFAGYLSECFALENLLFLERAIILYHAIRKYEKEDNEFQMHIMASSDEKHKKLYNQNCYELQFNYLCQIRVDIDQMIENTNSNDDKMKYKRGIVNVMQVLYKQFCCYDSVTEINVSYETQVNIRYLFQYKTEDEIMNQFKNYNDLKMVFHYAIIQCWEMCLSVYGFQFKTYIKRNRIKNRLSVPGKHFTEPQNNKTSGMVMNMKKQLSVIADNYNDKPVAHNGTQSESNVKNMDANPIDANVVTPETPLLIVTPKEMDLNVVYEMTVIETKSGTI
eukprot:293441_1